MLLLILVVLLCCCSISAKRVRAAPVGERSRVSRDPTSPCFTRSYSDRRQSRSDVAPSSTRREARRALCMYCRLSLLYNPETPSVCWSVIMISRSTAFRPRLAAWVERVGDPAARTLGLMPRRGATGRAVVAPLLIVCTGINTRSRGTQRQQS